MTEPGPSMKIGFYGETPRPLAEVLDVELDRYEARIHELMKTPPRWRLWRRKTRARREAEWAAGCRALDAIDDERFRRETAGMPAMDAMRLGMVRRGYMVNTGSDPARDKAP